MRKYIYIIFLAIVVLFTHTGCDDFFGTKNREGVEVDGGLSTTTNVRTALNGAYYNLYYYKFCGNYAVSIGDIASDLTYFTFQGGHFTSIYSYNITDEDSYMLDIWEYGYKVADNATRIIEAYDNIYAEQTPTDQVDLDVMVAEAYGLRALAYLYMSNVFCLPYKVEEGGVNNGEELGLVILEKPVGVNDKVSRSTIAKTYEAMLSDLDKSLTYFTKVNKDRGFEYINPSAVHALKARIYLYMEDYTNAITEANTALAAQKGKIITDADAYKAMYTSLATADGETILNIHVDAANNLSANSPGTLWTKYYHMPSVKYGEYLDPLDIRQVLMERDDKNLSTGGKFKGVTDNPAVSSQRLVGMPEMYLIIAEASLKKSAINISDAQKALLEVAKRNPDIKTVSDLPSTKNDLIKFVEDERVRELIQEGHRFQDCRRWGKKISVYLSNEATGTYKFNNFDVSKFCYPIPYAETSTGAGVEQNPNWSTTLPTLPK